MESTSGDAGMFCYIWEFVAASGQEDAFRRAYGPDGPWVQLFRRDPAYIRTELSRDADNPRRFVTIDYWTSRDACRAFRERVRDECAAIDLACERCTERERHIGDFDVMDGA